MMAIMRAIGWDTSRDKRMIKVSFYEHYSDVIHGFYTTKIYHDWEYKAIVEDILESRALTVSIRKTS